MSWVCVCVCMYFGTCHTVAIVCAYYENRLVLLINELIIPVHADCVCVVLRTYTHMYVACYGLCVFHFPTCTIPYVITIEQLAKDKDIQSNPIQFQTKPIHAKQTHCICLLIFVRLSVVTIWLLVCQVRFRSRTQRNSKYKNSNSRYRSLLIHNILAHAFGRAKSDLDYCYYSHRCCCCCFCHSVTKATFLQYIPKLSNNVH